MSLWAMYENEQEPPNKDKISDYFWKFVPLYGLSTYFRCSKKSYDYPRVQLERQKVIHVLKDIQALPALHLNHHAQQFFAPKTLRDFAALRLQLPQARIVAGSTDVWFVGHKQGRNLGDMLLSVRWKN